MFFTTREELERAKPFDQFLSKAANIDAVFSTGRGFRYERENWRRITRLILPEPTAPSFQFYEGSVSERLADDIENAIEECRKRHIEVRLSPIFVQQAFMIGDADKPDGWILVEEKLPFMTGHTKRPCFIVEKKAFPGVVSLYKETFEKLWNKSRDPATAASVGTLAGVAYARLSVSDPRCVPSVHTNADRQYSMLVHNGGPAAASNVQMKLRGASPGPHNPSWLADYPYVVLQPGRTLDSNDCQINADDDATFNICFVHPDGDAFAIGGLDTKNAGVGLPTIGKNERWELGYNVTAGNSELLKFALEIFVRDGTLIVQKKD